MSSLARLVLISPFLLLVGCGSDSTTFKEPSGKGGADAGLSSGGTGGKGGSSGSKSSGGRMSGGGTGAVSTAGSPSGDAEPPEPGTDSGAGGNAGSPSDAASGGGATADSGGCPKGTTSVGGKCLSDNSQACKAGADCASGNCVGGACCAVACDSPGACEKAAGTVCQNGDTCVYGSQNDGFADPKCPSTDKCTGAATCFAGACVAGAAVDCADTNACTVDACDNATGCTHTLIDVTKPGNPCDDDNVCTTDTCSTTLGCQHTNSNGVKVGCNDNNACTTDICSGGLCLSTPLDCSSKTNQCNTGVCVAGVCQAQPANVNAACTQGLTTCDAGGKCNGSGVCASTGSACGALSTACATCTTGANCQAGRLCTCQAAPPPTVIAGGVCIVNTNNCAAVPPPCGTFGTACTDPTPNGTDAADFTCTCAKGYSQKTPGTPCTDINECGAATNPCVAGTCTNTAGSYDCTCASPLTKITTAAGPQCACNLAGTYALIANTVITYPPITVGPITAIEGSPPGGVPTVGWSLRYNTVNAAAGTLTSQTISCGGTTPDLCDTVFGLAHAQYQPASVWGLPAMNAQFPTITTPLSGVVPSGTYTEPTLNAVSGIKLDNNAGAWPRCAECVGPTHTVGSTCTCPGGAPFTITNGAQWLNNPDGLGHLGFTTFAVPPGGLTTASPNPPPYNYTEPSVCPRIADPHGSYDYAEFPGVATNGVGFRAYSWHAGSRLQSVFKVDSKVAGQSISAQCTLTGAITGPDNGHAKAEARVQGCEICAGATGCTPGGACSQAQYDSYDQVDQSQQIVSATFTLAPAPAGVGDLGAVLAMPDGAAKTTAIQKACGVVRAAYPFTPK